MKKSIARNTATLVLLSLVAFNAGAQDANAPAQATAEAAPAPATNEVAADPAVWGPYAKLVGKTFAGEDLAGWPNYASKTRTIQWEVPGQVMLETGQYANGTPIPEMRIKPGKNPGEIVFDVKRAPNATGRVVDADTLQFDLMMGYQNIVRMNPDGSYEMKTLKRGELQAHAVYRDVNSEGHKQAEAAREEKAMAEKDAARLALRAAGVPDEPATPLPAERVLAYQETVRGPSGTLRITRGKAWDASACYSAVYINGRWAGRFEERETATFKVPAGKVVIAVGADPQGRGTCRMGGDSKTEHETVIAKGESLHVHYAYSGGPKFKEAVIPPEQGTAAAAP